jgi:hypothetical protein
MIQERKRRKNCYSLASERKGGPTAVYRIITRAAATNRLSFHFQSIPTFVDFALPYYLYCLRLVFSV